MMNALELILMAFGIVFSTGLTIIGFFLNRLVTKFDNYEERVNDLKTGQEVMKTQHVNISERLQKLELKHG